MLAIDAPSENWTKQKLLYVGAECWLSPGGCGWFAFAIIIEQPINQHLVEWSLSVRNGFDSILFRSFVLDQLHTITFSNVCRRAVKYRPRNILIRGCPNRISIPAPYHRWSGGSCCFVGLFGYLWQEWNIFRILMNIYKLYQAPTLRSFQFIFPWMVKLVSDRQ